MILFRQNTFSLYNIHYNDYHRLNLINTLTLHRVLVEIVHVKVSLLCNRKTNHSIPGTWVVGKVQGFSKF